MSREVTSTHQTPLGQSFPSPSETTWCVHCDSTSCVHLSCCNPSLFPLSSSSFPLQYKLVHFGFTHFSVNDFYEVQSMRGVYITTTVANGEYTRVWVVSPMWFCHPSTPPPPPPPPHTHTDGGHITMITFDNGGQWQRLRPPTDSQHCVSPACDPITSWTSSPTHPHTLTHTALSCVLTSPAPSLQPTGSPQVQPLSLDRPSQCQYFCWHHPRTW